MVYSPHPAEGFSLYLHVPFCRNLCPYCHFYRCPPPPGVERPFLRAVLAEAGERRKEFKGPARTLYLGGGTPSLLPPSWHRELTAGLGRAFPFHARAERSVEANPETPPPDLAGLAESYDRLSLGVQSFQARSLELLGRKRMPERDVLALFALLKKANRANKAGTSLGLDLIYGFEGQTLEDLRADLRTALALGADHISLYALEAREDGGGPREADPDLAAAMFREARRQLAAGGLAPYEICNFARPGHRCLHNLNYWGDGDYLGLGPGAHSSLTEGGVRRRWRNREDLEGYLADPAGCRELLEEEGPDSRAPEALIIGLRREEGVDRGAFRRRYGPDPVELFPGSRLFRDFAAQGLLVSSPRTLRLTPRGMLLSNEVFQSLLP